MKRLLIALYASIVLGQSQKVQSPAPKSPPAEPEFFDKPEFVVSGVTDYTYRGGHGSDSVLRSTEAVTKAAASLGTEATLSSMPLSVATAMEKSLRKKVAAEPENAELHHSLATVDERLGDSLEAVREYQRAAELKSSERNLFDWGGELLSHRAGEPAIEVFTKGNRLFPDSIQLMLGLAAAFYLHGDYDQAAERFFAASDVHPSDPMPYLFLGKVQADQITGSAGYLERFARFASVQPDNAWANYYYAACLWKRRANLEDFATVTQVRLLLERATHLDPHLGAAYLLLGVLYSDQKDLTNAISAYRKTIESSPEMEEPHYRLSQVYALSGDKVNAQKELDLYKQLADKSAQDVERERRELQQFVFTLRDGKAASQSKPNR